MKSRTTTLEQRRYVRARFRIIEHYEQVSCNVSQTCRFFGISRSQFYVRLRTYVSSPTVLRILRAHHVPRVSLKRYRPGPRRRHNPTIPGQSVQIDVKHLKVGSGRFYQFTAIDFIEGVRERLPVAIQRIETDHGSESAPISRGTCTTWGSPIASSRWGGPRVTGRWNAATARTRRSSTVGFPLRAPRNCSPSYESGSTGTTIAARAWPCAARLPRNASASCGLPLPRV